MNFEDGARACRAFCDVPTWKVFTLLISNKGTELFSRLYSVEDYRGRACRAFAMFGLGVLIPWKDQPSYVQNNW